MGAIRARHEDRGAADSPANGTGRRPLRASFGDRTRDSRGMRYLHRGIVVLVGIHIVLASISGYRAIVQIYSLDLRAPAEPLRAGAAVGFTVVTSGRTDATVDLTLNQGDRVEPLAVHRVRGNNIASYDPRAPRESAFVTLSAELLNRLQPGTATLRATAVGRSQWLRTPPPTVREQVVHIVR